jgi:dienelactone hydrolase
MHGKMAETNHSCCRPLSPDALWKGTPTGKIINIEDIETYITKPPITPDTTKNQNNNRVILFLTEAHGIYLPNSQLLADLFASHLNCDVIMPDQFAGHPRQPKSTPSEDQQNKATRPTVVPHTDDPSDPNFENVGLRIPLKENTETSDAWPFLKPPGWTFNNSDFEEWKVRHEPHITEPIIYKAVAYIHSTYGKGVKIGGVGYCFGGRYVIRLMGQGVMDVGVINHPSFYTMDEVAKLGGKKLAIFAAEIDDILPKEKRRETEDVLVEAGAKWMCTVYGGTEHGFSVRGDLREKEMRIAKEKAFRGAVEWFRDWL